MNVFCSFQERLRDKANAKIVCCHGNNLVGGSNFNAGREGNSSVGQTARCTDDRTWWFFPERSPDSEQIRKESVLPHRKAKASPQMAASRKVLIIVSFRPEILGMGVLTRERSASPFFRAEIASGVESVTT